MTIHYVTDNWNFLERVLYTTLRENSSKKTRVNIKTVVMQNLEAFAIAEQLVNKNQNTTFPILRIQMKAELIVNSTAALH